MPQFQCPRDGQLFEELPANGRCLKHKVLVEPVDNLESDLETETETEAAPHTLTDNQLARAVRANPRWRNTLGPEWPSDVDMAAAQLPQLRGAGDFEFAEAVAKYQARSALGFDGIVGKVTSARIRNVASPEPGGDEFLTVGGRARPAPGCRVVKWDDPNGLSFVGLNVWRPRRADAQIDLFVVHHDGCRSSRQCYDVLVERGLSVHLMLDRDGTIYQGLDLQTAVALHAGPANARSIAVEICNPERTEGTIRTTRGRWGRCR